MKLTDKIHLLRIDFEILLGPDKKLPRFVNVIIIFGNNITLIDTGVKGSEKIIFEYIEKNMRTPAEIKTIILSHAHPDHIGSAAAIKELTDCQVLAHPDETEWIEHIDVQNRQRPVPGFYSLVDKGVKVDGTLNEGQLIQADDDITLEINYSPGHSKGSVNIFFREDKILFTADSIPLKNDIPNYDSYNDLMQSLQHIKQNKNYSILLSSWTAPHESSTEIKKLIHEGEEYMMKLNKAVKANYLGDETVPLAHCRSTIEMLGLPPFLVNPVVDKAFRSHR
jgi:hydroxyacylglutathione hydrolase